MPDQEPQGQGGASELASFGEDLRREREIRGISLKEISDATKISKRFLDALERNDHRTLPAPVFTRGFVREYSRYVGLNSEEMVNRYNHAVALDDRIEKPPQVQKYPQTPVREIAAKPLPKRGIPPVYARVDRNAIALVLIAAALAAVAWWAVKVRRTEGDAPEPVDVRPTASATASVPAIPPPLPPPSQPQDDGTLRLVVLALENSWVTLEADGKTVVNAELVQGERRTWEAKEVFRFRTIGNAAGLRVTLNGHDLPPFGGDGEVVKNRILDHELLEQTRAGSAAPSTRS